MLHRVLSNGLEVVVKENHFAKMVAIQCWVGAGSIHEEQNEHGMAHCIEHMLFKGTEKHQVGEISGQVEAYGGDINAYTTFDHTVYYLTLSSLYARQGLDLLADAIFHSSFDAEELQREKEVILEEIRRSMDSPGHLIGRRIFETIYRGSAAARPIIGYAETVAEFQRKDLLAYYQRLYQPTNMKVVVVGDFDAKEMFEWIEEAFGKGTMKAVPSPAKLAPAPLEKLDVQMIRGDYEQPRLEIGFRGPSLEHNDTIDLDLAAFALGAGDASRLNKRLRDQEEVATALGASLYSPHFDGIFELSAVPLPERYLDCVRGIARELARLIYHEPVSHLELQRARANLKADQLYQEETVAGQARALGFSLLTSHKTAYDAVYAARVGASNGETIQNALHRWFDIDRPVIACLVPEGLNIDEKAIAAAYRAGVAEGRNGTIDRFKTLNLLRSVRSDDQVFRKTLSNGVEFVYRRNVDCGLFNLIAVTEGGLRSEDESTAGRSHSFASLLASATQSLDSDALTELVEGSGAVLAGFSGKDSMGLKLQCFSEHGREMTHLWADCLLRPSFPATKWRNTLNEIQDEMRSEKDSPAGLAVRSFQEALYADHPYRFPIYGLWSEVESWSESKLEQDFAAYRDQGKWTIGGVSDWLAEDVVHLLEASLHGWRPSEARRTFKASAKDLRFPSSRTVELVKKREQTHIVRGTLGLAWGDPRRAAMDVLSTILGGSGGRLFLNLRDRDSLAYTVTPILSYGCHPGVFGAYIACAPAKVEQALAGLEREFQIIKDNAPTDQELERAKNYLIGGHESEMQRGDAQAMTMALMEAYGIGYDDFLQYSERIRKVSCKDVQAVAREFLSRDQFLTVTVGAGKEAGNTASS